MYGVHVISSETDRNQHFVIVLDEREEVFGFLKQKYETVRNLIFVAELVQCLLVI